MSGPQPAEAAERDPTPAERVALEWVDAVMDESDMRKVWTLTHPTLRLVLVQQWILGYRGDPVVGPQEDWDALAAGLAASPSRHELWHRFADERLERWREFWVGFDTRTWKIAEAPEKLSSDLEVVSFIERKEGADEKGSGGRGVLARRFAVRRMPGGWKVAGLDGARLFRPGWPPAPAAGAVTVPAAARRAAPAAGETPAPPGGAGAAEG